MEHAYGMCINIYIYIMCCIYIIYIYNTILHTTYYILYILYTIYIYTYIMYSIITILSISISFLICSTTFIYTIKLCIVYVDSTLHRVNRSTQDAWRSHHAMDAHANLFRLAKLEKISACGI